MGLGEREMNASLVGSENYQEFTVLRGGGREEGAGEVVGAALLHPPRGTRQTAAEGGHFLPAGGGEGRPQVCPGVACRVGFPGAAVTEMYWHREVQRNTGQGVQRLRICLPMQGTRFNPVLRESQLSGSK